MKFVIFSFAPIFPLFGQRAECQTCCALWGESSPMIADDPVEKVGRIPKVGSSEPDFHLPAGKRLPVEAPSLSLRLSSRRITAGKFTLFEKNLT